MDEVSVRRGAVRRLMSQGAKFGLVGLVATAVHITIFVICIELAGMRPFWANFPAFGMAVVVGFIGHFSWTFRDQTSRQGRPATMALARFSATAVLGFSLNSLVVFTVVDLAGLAYPFAAVLMATAVPATVFLVSKFWAFA
jgi:putative flippase GtrA